MINCLGLKYLISKEYMVILQKKYSIRAIPQMFILDEHNKIVALNLRGERIEAAIRDVLE